MDRMHEILTWYRHQNPGVVANIARILNHGALAGTGKLLILPVDQGVEHGPGRSFAANPPAYDPRYHAQLALDAGCNAYAAPLGAIQSVAEEYAWRIPLILKVNGHELLMDEPNPMPALTGSVRDALQLGCAAVGYTIYPGTAERRVLYEQLREVMREAHDAGLAVVVWSYPRGGDISQAGETALDVVAYAAHLAAQFGADLIKVKLPSAQLELPAARKVYEQHEVPTGSLAERVRHVVQSAFEGRRIVIFSGGAAKDDAAVFEEVRAIRDGGGFGSIIGRNSFQRGHDDAVKFLQTVVQIIRGEIQ